MDTTALAYTYTHTHTYLFLYFGRGYLRDSRYMYRYTTAWTFCWSIEYSSKYSVIQQKVQGVVYGKSKDVCVDKEREELNWDKERKELNWEFVVDVFVRSCSCVGVWILRKNICGNGVGMAPCAPAGIVFVPLPESRTSRERRKLPTLWGDSIYSHIRHMQVDEFWIMDGMWEIWFRFLQGIADIPSQLFGKV